MSLLMVLHECRLLIDMPLHGKYSRLLDEKDNYRNYREELSARPGYPLLPPIQGIMMVSDQKEHISQCQDWWSNKSVIESIERGAGSPTPNTPLTASEQRVVSSQWWSSLASRFPRSSDVYLDYLISDFLDTRKRTSVSAILTSSEGSDLPDPPTWEAFTAAIVAQQVAQVAKGLNDAVRARFCTVEFNSIARLALGYPCEKPLSDALDWALAYRNTLFRKIQEHGVRKPQWTLVEIASLPSPP
jgi:hypothetical protein